MKIISLKSKNVKNLKAVEITPEGSTVILTGKNGAGKSAVLDSIQYAFSGKSIPTKPIRDGEENAKVEIDCGEFTVTRTFGLRGNSLKIETKTGDLKKSPQAFLDNIVGKISFDPMEFINMEAKKQAKVLMDLIGIDVAALDEKEAELELKRTEAGREYRKLKGAFDVLIPVQNPPEKEVSSSELFAELEKARAFNNNIEKIKSETSNQSNHILEIKKSIGEEESKIDNLKKEIEQAEIRIKEKNKLISEVTDKKRKYENSIEKADLVDTSTIEEKIRNVDHDNAHYRKHQEFIAAEEKLKEAIQDGKEKTSALENFREEKAEQIKKAKYPIDGLSVTSDGVCFNGIPINQINTAEQIKVGVAVSMALNPTLKVLRISDGSLLDSNSLKIIDSLVKEKDYQCWLEKVDESGKVGIYIEEGEVIKQNK